MDVPQGRPRAACHIAPPRPERLSVNLPVKFRFILVFCSHTLTCVYPVIHPPHLKMLYSQTLLAFCHLFTSTSTCLVTPPQQTGDRLRTMSADISDKCYPEILLRSQSAQPESCEKQKKPALGAIEVSGLIQGPNGDITMLTKGFEPTTFRSQVRQPNLLRYTLPTCLLTPCTSYQFRAEVRTWQNIPDKFD